MTDLLATRSALLDNIIQKDGENKLDWTFDEKQKSAQAEFGEFEINIDEAARAGGAEIKIWLFSDSGEEIDSFSIRDSITASTTRGLDRFFPQIKSLYNKIREREAVKKIAPAIDRLKGL
ncbi:MULTISPECIES: hypothetical protein [unclassified Sphingopyxis]|uniref:hypothetical protein n=1 Tax=unclassified Sphingopyxis TaxID=2614943 RepID=UPI000736E7B0|nr:MULTISPECIES: hypothetical protein [unclassified Sphingopyxis]KTE82323.1 hypothetical protein ATE72_16030 [Sphingopyxis sp. HXXIV]